ncbi:NAD-dependent epimerase/dehydratase family protein [Paraliomyxa miuraensis]|uniref:NAD-dependent epimerase/dehydratase family protein n=1 Tax=Paraliomyxa miuraensis TaxID=376150 RepID=UPI00224DD261|nr:NAD-dependent epimerase/dehydratase family protein [Paraliomyxa miuraensis]MCX4243429.1 NAD-dependent epimerase/dehydratase family protein [Paraliomyxa miuraensis]
MASDSPNSRTILVTGASGFVGRHLVDAFADRGGSVIAVDVAGKPWRDDIRWEHGDVRERERMVALCEGVDVVVHNASVVHTRRNKESFVWDVNHGGTRTMIDACRTAGVERLVYMSSASVVYEGRDIVGGDERLPYSSISQAPYADSKIAAEQDALAANGDDLAVCALRPHVVFGPHDQRLLPALLQRARAGKLKLGVGSGDKLSDFTYVSNLVDATVSAAERLAPGSAVAGQAYFITNGEPMDFFAFVDAVLVELGMPKIRGRVPFAVAYPVAAIKETWDTLKGGSLGNEGNFSRFSVRYMCTHHYFSIAKARRDLDYEPKVSIAEGIERTIEHLREHGEA